MGCILKGKSEGLLGKAGIKGTITFSLPLVFWAVLGALINMVFPVVMYGCESWTVKKAEH